MADLYAEMVERIFAIRAASDQRRAERGKGGVKGTGGGDEEIPVTAFVSFFERPPR
jgi:hypothetical protein